MIHDPNNLHFAGKSIEEAGKVLIMVHGRGSSANAILSLSQYIQDNDFAFVAPEATGNTWYPHSFLRPTEENEPYLSSALQVLTSLRARLQADFNVKLPQMYWLGFSQGACLMLEFIARNPTQYGGIFGLSGALIGPDLQQHPYHGDLGQTPIFLGCSDTDSHIPKARFLESEAVFQAMGANVTARLYPNFEHSINEDELNFVNSLIAGTSGQ